MTGIPHLQEPPPPSGQPKPLARIVRGFTLVVGITLIVWAADAVFWDNQVVRTITAVFR